MNECLCGMYTCKYTQHSLTSKFSSIALYFFSETNPLPPDRSWSSTIDSSVLPASPKNPCVSDTKELGFIMACFLYTMKASPLQRKHSDKFHLRWLSAMFLKCMLSSVIGNYLLCKPAKEGGSLVMMPLNHINDQHDTITLQIQCWDKLLDYNQQFSTWT